MAENRAYKLNAQKQPGSKRGTYIYYYYDSEGHFIGIYEYRRERRWYQPLKIFAGGQ